MDAFFVFCIGNRIVFWYTGIEALRCIHFGVAIKFQQVPQVPSTNCIHYGHYKKHPQNEDVFCVDLV